MKNSECIKYYKDHQLIEEKNLHASWLQFLYTNSLGKLLRFFLKRRLFCKLAGYYYNSRWSKNRIQPFIAYHHINMSDFQVPPGGYQSFNEFFIRKLKPESRTINQNHHVVISPTDAKLYIIPNISTDTLFFVKHKPFNLEKFLGNRQLAHLYHQGVLAIFRLAPYDYHRYHFPVDCIPTAPVLITGDFESVNPIAFRAGIQPLTENERHMTILKTEKFDDIIMMAVGATMVGKVVYNFSPHIRYKKGDEAGYFAFGGSTIVLLFKQHTLKPQQLFIQHSLQGFETAIKMGEAINE